MRGGPGGRDNPLGRFAFVGTAVRCREGPEERQAVRASWTWPTASRRRVMPEADAAGVK